jgi:hypothetical protein
MLLELPEDIVSIVGSQAYTAECLEVVVLMLKARKEAN